jgi:hypothetical protein
MQVHRKVNAALPVAKNVTMMHLRKRHFRELPLYVLEPESRPLSSNSPPGSHDLCDLVEHISLQ